MVLGMWLGACGDDVSTASGEGTGGTSSTSGGASTPAGSSTSPPGTDATGDADSSGGDATTSSGAPAASTSSTGGLDGSSSSDGADTTSTGGSPSSCGVPPQESDAFCGEGQHCDDDACVDDLPLDASCDEQSDCASGWCAADVCRAAGPHRRLGSTFYEVNVLVRDDGTTANWGRATEVDQLTLPSTSVHTTGTCLLDDEGNASCVTSGGVVSGAGFHQFDAASLGLGGCGIVGEGTIECLGGEPFKGVPAGNDYVQVSVGNHVNACGLRQDGSVSCSDPNPGWASMYAGPFEFIDVHASIMLCGIRPDGSLLCAHQNGVTASQVELEGPFVDVQAEFLHFCAVRDTGEVHCERIDGLPLTQLEQPPQGTYTEVVTTLFRACALEVDGTVDCWGSTSPASWGQVDDFPRPASALAPSSDCRVVGLDPDGAVINYAGCSGFSLTNLDMPGSYEEIHAVSDVVCGRRGDGHGVCWSPTWTDTVDLGLVQHICGANLSPAQQEPYACWIGTDDQLACSGLDVADEPWSAIPLGDATSVECADGFACAVLAGGAVECWGAPSATPVPGAGSFATLTCGADSCCGTAPDGSPSCFGPFALSLPGTYDELCVGEGVFCGRTPDGAIDCDFDVAEDADFEATPAATDFVDLGCGRGSACAIAQDGAVECWGLAEVSR